MYASQVFDFFVDPFRGPLPRDLATRFFTLQKDYRIALGDKPPADAIAHLLGPGKAKALRWDDLYVLERAWLSVVPDAALPETVIEWQRRLRQTIGALEYTEYLKAKPLDPMSPNVTAEQLRGTLYAICDQIHYILALSPGRERMRNRLSFWTGIVTIAVFATLCAFLMGSIGPSVSALGRQAAPPGIATLVLVALTGLLGGFISVQQRLQSVTATDPLLKRLEMSAGFWNIVFVSPSEGGVFAIVLCMIFAAGILHGGVFPEMYGAIAPSKAAAMSGAITLDAFLARIGPVSFRDYSLLIVWSFVAGFFERLVPDVLTRLTQQAKTP